MQVARPPLQTDATPTASSASCPFWVTGLQEGLQQPGSGQRGWPKGSRETCSAYLGVAVEGPGQTSPGRAGSVPALGELLGPGLEGAGAGLGPCAAQEGLGGASGPARQGCSLDS